MFIKRFSILLEIFFCLLIFQGCDTNISHSENLNVSSCQKYQIIKDDLGIFIEVAVDKKISEDQMRCILVDVADKHQFDKARDYLWSNYLWVEIYLREKGSKMSQNTCARLRRFVPKDELKNTSNPEDKFFFSIEKCLIQQ